MLLQRLQEILKKSRFVLYLLFILSGISVVMILSVIIEWIGGGINLVEPSHVMNTVAAVFVLGCTYIARNSIRHMEKRMKSMKKIFLTR